MEDRYHLKYLKKHFSYWLKTASLTFQSLTATRPASLMFIAGKFIRFFFFIWFLVVLGDRVQKVAGYTLTQLIMFFLVFNIFDLFGQLFFRGIYHFRGDVISGKFDFNLAKPINPLFQALVRHTDFLDIPLFIVVLVFFIKQLLNYTLANIFLLFLVSIGAVILITAFHIIVASIGVLTTEVDHTIMVYRDLSTMARFPIDIYTDAIRALLTFVIPIAIVFTFPAKALMALLSPGWIAFSLIFSLFIFWLSLKLWQYSLTQYSSASS
jgi:ABC-2 type transport system permease protein